MHWMKIVSGHQGRVIFDSDPNVSQADFHQTVPLSKGSDQEIALAFLPPLLAERLRRAKFLALKLEQHFQHRRSLYRKSHIQQTECGELQSKEDKRPVSEALNKLVQLTENH